MTTFDTRDPLVRQMDRVAEQRKLDRIAVLESQLAAARDEALEEAAQIADSFTCGACGMDGQAGKAIRAARTGTARHGE